MCNWISTMAMSEKYDLTIDALHAFSYANKGSVYTKKDGKNVLFNDSVLINAMNKKIKIWNASHDYYYWLRLDAKMNESVQARLLLKYTKLGTEQSWITFLNNGMWRPIDQESILCINTKKRYLDLYCQWCEEYIPKIKKKIRSKKTMPTLLERE